MDLVIKVIEKEIGVTIAVRGNYLLGVYRCYLLSIENQIQYFIYLNS